MKCTHLSLDCCEYSPVASVYTLATTTCSVTLLCLSFFRVNCPTALAFIIANYAIVSTVVNFYVHSLTFGMKFVVLVERCGL